MTYYTNNGRNATWWFEDGDPIPSGLVAITQAEAARIPEPLDPAVLLAQAQATYTAAAQALLDRAAQERGYDGVLSLCSYATSTNPRFAAEAAAGVAWRDAVWARGYEVLAQVEAGEMAPPTQDEFLAMLPTIVWP